MILAIFAVMNSPDLFTMKSCFVEACFVGLTLFGTLPVQLAIFILVISVLYPDLARFLNMKYLPLGFIKVSKMVNLRSLFM